MRVANIEKIQVSLIIILAVVIFFPTIVSMGEKFLKEDSYYSHGFLVPLVSAYLIWRKRETLRKLLPHRASSKSGLAMLVGGLLLHLASVGLRVNVGSYLSLLIVIGGLVWYILGKEITRQLLFPIAFLVFMIPLPSVVLINMSFRMKIFASHIASFLVNKMGVSTSRAGSTIYLPHTSLTVGDPCSGLRSLISLLALGALFTQFMCGSAVRKITLFLTAIPIALGSNVLRIMLLLLVTHVYGENVALGFFHDLSGVLVFVFAFAGLALANHMLKCHIVKPT